MIGFAILAYVLVNAQVSAQTLGLAWFVVGLVIMVALVASRPHARR